MAFSLKIIANSTDGLSLEIEPYWWSYRELLRAYPFVKQAKDGYLDYRLSLNHEAFVDLFLEQYKRYQQGSNAYHAWQSQNEKVMAELETVIKSPETYPEVKIWIYEWESGH